MLGRLIGTLLKGVRAGDKYLAWNAPPVASAPEVITLTSDDFEAGGVMPIKFAGKGVGDNVSPSLKWSNLPAGTVELVLVMEDPDAPMPKPFIHLVATGISPSLGGFATGALSAGAAPNGISYGKDTLGRKGYNGPRAPKGHGPHHYLFEIYALNKALEFSAPPGLADVVNKLDGVVIGRGKLQGIFEQK
jgi:Raf kinase inhibitor-like YbhB/YbcL family protein